MCRCHSLAAVVACVAPRDLGPWLLQLRATKAVGCYRLLPWVCIPPNRLALPPGSPHGLRPRLPTDPSIRRTRTTSRNSHATLGRSRKDLKKVRGMCASMDE